MDEQQGALKRGPPQCFAKEWDPKETECTGGLDPAYTNDNRRSANYATHIRDRCIWFGECGTRMQAMKMEGARDLISPSSLVRPVSQDANRQYWENKARAAAEQKQREEEEARRVGQPPAFTQFAYSMASARQKEEMERYQRDMAEMHRRGYTAPVPMMPFPGYGAQPMMPMNFQMPGYLTVPETMFEGRSFWEMLATTVFRSLAKSAGHSVAHVFDSIPWGSPQLPRSDLGPPAK